MNDFNDIGISRELDFPRIEKLLTIGLISGVMVFIGDWLLGYGTYDESITGFAANYLSKFLNVSDSGIIASGILGLIGITLESLSYFSIYRLIVCKSPDMAHSYRTGIIGMAVFGACGVHVPCCAIAWIYRHIYALDSSVAVDIAMGYAEFFVLPATVLFLIFFTVLSVVQIKAFVKGQTPLPKWCRIFCLPVGMLIAQIPSAFAAGAWVEALSTAWISVGDIWMCGGLLYMTKKTAKKYKS